MLISYHSAALL